MPRKTDYIPINNELLDRRVKLTKEQKELIVWLREEEQISYQKLANQFNVSKRSIIFICRPELKVKDLENRKKRGGSKIYYNREKHTTQIREHRDYKKELNEKGLLIHPKTDEIKLEINVFNMVINKLEEKKVRECKDYQLRVLFLDPTPIYDRIKVNHFSRFQSVSIYDIFPSNDKLCSCGCGKELSGKQKRWASDSCKYFAQAVWGIINGHTQIISSYLRLYHGFEACIKCGLTDSYSIQSNGLSVNNIHIDHIVAVINGGGGCWLSNYQYLCKNCHNEKTNIDLKRQK